MPKTPYEYTQTVIQTKKCMGVKYKSMTASSQWEFLCFRIYTILQRYDIDYCLYPEFHAPPNYNLHIHGTLLIPENLSKLDLVDIRKHFEDLGRVTLSKIHDRSKWNSYMIKDQKEIGDLHYISPNYSIE